MYCNRVIYECIKVFEITKLSYICSDSPIITIIIIQQNKCLIHELHWCAKSLFKLVAKLIPNLQITYIFYLCMWNYCQPIFDCIQNQFWRIFCDDLLWRANFIWSCEFSKSPRDYLKKKTQNHFLSFMNYHVQVDVKINSNDVWSWI